jgi:hypothetical protein
MATEIALTGQATLGRKRNGGFYAICAASRRLLAGKRRWTQPSNPVQKGDALVVTNVDPLAPSTIHLWASLRPLRSRALLSGLSRLEARPYTLEGQR